LGRALRLGPVGEEGLYFFFSEILFSAKTNPEKCFKALKILRKSQKI
jgi:hypothetical protein